MKKELDNVSEMWFWVLNIVSNTIRHIISIETDLCFHLVHYQCIIHGDLKPANLLLGENGRIIIADLGVCDDISECDDDKLEFSRGSPAFRSPESLHKDTRGFSGKVIFCQIRFNIN